MVVAKNGQVFFYTLMLGIVIIVLGISFAGPITSIVNGVMSDAGCSVIDSDWEQAFCWFLDLSKPVLIGTIILVGAGVLAARELLAR